MKPNEYITADTHFSHENIIKLCDRPFKSVEEMDEELIRRWNEKIPEDAVVYHMGDFFLSGGSPREMGEKMRGIVLRLNGRIRFFPGNHDSWMLTSPEYGLGPKKKFKDLVALFEWFRPFSWHESRTEDGQKVVMCHYAFDVWNASHRGSWHLYGHSHGSLLTGARVRMDIGVDSHPNYEPFSFQEIADRLSGLESEAVDHHGKPRTDYVPGPVAQ